MFVESGKRFLSLYELADNWGVCDKTIRNYIKQNLLAAMKINGRIYISEEESSRFQRENSVVRVVKRFPMKEAR